MIEIRPFTDKHVEVVGAFNRRLAGGGCEFRFPESPLSAWLPRRDSIPLYEDYFLAFHGDRVCGGYVLKSQAFVLRGGARTLGNLRLPLSEGVVDRRYAMVGSLLLKDVLARQPLLFALGMGGYDRPLVRLLRAMRWRMVSCPFYFLAVHPNAVLRELVYLRRRRAFRLALDALAGSGLGWLGLKTLAAFKALLRPGRGTGARYRVVDRFSDWADAIWTSSAGAYELIAVRDAAILNRLYPTENGRFIRLQVLRGGETVGWAVALDTPMTGHKYFGGMRVGSAVDCLAEPGREADVVEAVTRCLVGRGVDLIVTNQLHRGWGEAFARAGYLSGPSNFIFAASPALADRLEPFEARVRGVHMTRGDGDGPIHL